MTKFQNKFRSESTRHPLWNYSWPSDYFITICLYPRKHLFGEIYCENMHLSEIGRVTEEEWKKTFEIRKDMNLSMGSFIVMPDHFHAIITIGENQYNNNAPGIYILKNPVRATQIIEEYKNSFGPQRKNLCSIIRGFKTSVKNFAVKNDIKFSWQDRYHDRIIRNTYEYDQISSYIKNNVQNWNQ